MPRLAVGSIISGGWENFRKICIHKDAPPVQIEEMRKAFYGGAVVVLTAMNSIAEQDVPDEVGAQVLESLHNEVRAFARDLGDNGAGGLTDQIWTPQGPKQ